MRNKRPRPSDMDNATTTAAGAAAPQGLDDASTLAAAGFQHEDGDDDGDDDDEDEGAGKKSDKKAGRRKIKIEFITDKSRRHITFSKRKAGIMKKVRCAVFMGYNVPSELNFATLTLFSFGSFSGFCVWGVDAKRVASAPNKITLVPPFPTFPIYP